MARAAAAAVVCAAASAAPPPPAAPDTTPPTASAPSPPPAPVSGSDAGGAVAPGPSAASAAAPPILADAADTRAATALLREAVVVRPGGRHHRLLRALRYLEDPDLEPLFRRLRENEHAALRVHGLLGTAELATPRGVTTENLVDLERDDQRAEVISAALDGGLLDDRTLDELLAWPGLADEVKLLLATPRVAAGRVAAGSPAHAAMVAALGGPAETAPPGGLNNPHPAAEPGAGVMTGAPPDPFGRGANPNRPATPARGLGRRGLAALLLHQMGDARGTRGLIALNNADVPSRDPVRATLLETARTHGLDRAGTWAYSIASEPDLPPRLAELALEVAAGFGDARAHRRWAEKFRAAENNLPRRTRLALTGLAFAAVARPEVFNVVAVDGDPFVAAVGRTARAVGDASQPAGDAAPPAGDAAQASGDAAQRAADPAPPAADASPPASETPTKTPDPAALTAALNNLHATDHPLAHAWLAGFAADPATPDAVAVATARRLVTGYRPGHATGRTRRLQAVLDAVETLLRRDPAAAAADVPAVLNRADADPAWTQAVLLGLIRSRTPAAAAIARGVAVPADPDAKALALVLRLRSGGAVGPRLRATLTRVLRGQTALDDELRVQAAWVYLKRTSGADAVSTLRDTDDAADADAAVARSPAAP